jgi:hypothetical protein
MTIEERAYALAESLGATLEDDDWAIQLLAPGDLVSGSNFVHTTCYPLEGRRTAWKQIITDLKAFGFVECDDLNCGAEHRDPSAK